jgi:hypothetical protein
MLGDFGIAEFTANCTQGREGALFVLTHQPRIASDIDRQNGRQPSLDPLLTHLARPVPQGDPRPEDMMELGLRRAPPRRGSDAEPSQSVARVNFTDRFASSTGTGSAFIAIYIIMSS